MTETHEKFEPCAAHYRAALKAVTQRVSPLLGQGRVADYIPALAQVPPERFGFAIHDCDCAPVACGDSETAFSIQSISKVFALVLAMQSYSEEELWQRVWREPSGTAFNSIVQLESDKGVPRNPFVNAGALVITDILISRYGRQGAIDQIVDFMRALVGEARVFIDYDVAASELDTAHKNAGLAYVIKSFGNLTNSVEDVLHVYCHQCALAMSASALAASGVFLARSGLDTKSGKQIVSNDIVRRVNALMLTCGHYDAAGDFAFRVGLPGKSGVGGGILAIVPERASIAVWSPGLNEYGNSLVGTAALEAFVDITGLEIL